MKELIYSDKVYETEFKSGLKTAYDAIVKLYNVWKTLDVGECNDIWALITNTSKVYSDAFNANVEVPKEIGRYQLNKSAFMNIIEVPVPNLLYLAGKQVQKIKHYGYNIWSIQDGEVVQDEVQAEKLILAKNVYAENESQKELGAAIVKYVEVSNFLDQKFKEIPWQHLGSVPWTNQGTVFPHLHQLTLEVELLRTMLSNIDV